jgi:hypothetical protein
LEDSPPARLDGSIAAQRREGGRMTRTAKVGLIVLAVVLMLLVALFVFNSMLTEESVSGLR